MIMENGEKSSQLLENCYQKTSQDYGNLETSQKLNVTDTNIEIKEEDEESTFAIDQNRINDAINIVPNQRGRVSVSKDLSVLAESMQGLKLGSDSSIPCSTKFCITKWKTPMKGNTSLQTSETMQNEFFSCEGSTFDLGVQNDSVQGDSIIDESPKSYDFMQADSGLRDLSKSDFPEIQNALSFDQTSNADFAEYTDKRCAAIDADLSDKNDLRNICDRTVHQETNNPVDKISAPKTDDSNKSSNVSGEVLNPEARDFSIVTDGNTLQDRVSKHYSVEVQAPDYMVSESSVCEQREVSVEGNAVLETEKSGVESTNVSVLQNTSVRSPEHRDKVEAPACQNGAENDGLFCGKEDTKYYNEDQNLSAEKIVTCEECPANVENLSVTVKSSEKSAEFDSPVFAYDSASQQKISNGIEEILFMNDHVNMLSVRTEVPHKQSAPTGELSPEVLMKEQLIQVNMSEIPNTGNELSCETKHDVSQERHGIEAEVQESRDANLVYDSKMELVNLPQLVAMKLMIEEDAEKPKIVDSDVVNNSDSPVSRDKTGNAEFFKTVETSAEEFKPDSKESTDSSHTISQNIQQKLSSPMIEEELPSRKNNPDISPTEIHSSPLSLKTDPDQVAEMCCLEAPTTKITPKMQSNALLGSAKTPASELQNLEQITGAFTGSLTHQIQIAEPSILDMSPASLENRINAGAFPCQKISLLDVSISKLENISSRCSNDQQTPTVGKLVDLSTVKKFRREEFNVEMNLGTLIEESNDLASVNEALESETDSVNSHESNCNDLETNGTVITMKPSTDLEDGNVASVKACSEQAKETTLLRNENAKLKSNIEEMRAQLRQLQEEKETSERNAQSAYKDLLREHERSQAIVGALKRNVDKLKATVPSYEKASDVLRKKYNLLEDYVNMLKANIDKELFAILEEPEKKKIELETKCAELQKDLEHKTNVNIEVKDICEQLFQILESRIRTVKLSKN